MLLVLIRWSIFRRHDLTEGLTKLQCKTLIFVGDSSEFHAESVYMSAKMGSKSCALVEVACSFSMHYLALALNDGNRITFMYSLT
jgi:hypothetical protein